MDRRSFISSSASLGTGLVLGFYLPARKALGQFGSPAPTNFPPNAFARIAPDNAITVISKHTEMGQGIYTGLATMLADELDADWSQMKVESAPVNVDLYRHFMLGIQGTGGSMSVPNAWLQYRTVGATMRAMLVSAAADSWQVAEDEIMVSRGVLSHSSGKQATFGEMGSLAASLDVPVDVTLKTPDQFTLIGTSVSKVDVPEKVDGSALYTIDVQRPGMKVAVVAHAPRFGATLTSFDDIETRKVAGVVDVVEIPRGLAVLANNTYAAIKGRDALKTEWDFSTAENRGMEDIVADYMKIAENPGLTVEHHGDSVTAIAEAAQTIEANYIFPYLAHATMEPLDCTIEVTGGKCVIRSGTQMPSVERDRVAELLGLSPENVTVETLYAGGGFGRRGNFVPDIAQETASIVKATNAQYPIKLQYTREDDMEAGYYRPLFVHQMKTALDAEGNITAWENRLVGQSFVKDSFFAFMIQDGIDPIAIEGSAELPYAVPNVSVDYHMSESGIPALAWRSVGHTHTGFSKETMMDELLHAGGKDPVAGRLALMEDERSKAVIRLAAEKAGWGSALEKDRGRGFAFVEAFSGRVAQIAEISLNSAGQITVEKVVCAVDCGTPINPGIIDAQIKSAIIFGLSAALYGEIKIEQGEVKTHNFDTYPVIRMNQAPEIEVYIMPSTEAPTGIGEPGTPPIAPAVANAYFNLTGKRIRRLPFEPV